MKVNKSILFLVTFSLVLSFAIAGCSQKEYNEELNDDLIKAIRDKDMVQITELLDAGANPSAKEKGDRPALMVAMLSFSMDLQKLTSKKPIKFSQTDTAEVTKIVKLLIDAGADVNAKNTEGFAPLFATWPRNFVQAAQMLIAAGANVNAKSNEGLSVLRYMAFNGSKEIVKLLIENGADLNVPDNQGATPLMAAIFKGHTEVAKILIDRGANVNVENNKGLTALIVSGFKGDSEISKMLIDKGVKVDHRDQDGGTALIAASYKGSVEIAKLLIDIGADVNAKTQKGQTALILAASQGHTGVVNLLLENGADKNIQDDTGQSALGYAKKNKQTKIVRILETKDEGDMASGSGLAKASQTKVLSKDISQRRKLAIVMLKDKWLRWLKPENLAGLAAYRKGAVKIAITSKEIEELEDPKQVKKVVATLVSPYESLYNRRIIFGLIPEDRIDQVLSMGLYECVFVWLEAHPWKPIGELKLEELALLHLSDKEIDLLKTNYSDVTPAVIPAGTYMDQAQDYKTIALNIVLTKTETTGAAEKASTASIAGSTDPNIRPGQVKGVFVNKNTGKPIEIKPALFAIHKGRSDAEIAALNTMKIKVETDSSGAFLIKNVLPGPYTLMVRTKMVTTVFKVPPGQTLDLGKIDIAQ